MVDLLNINSCVIMFISLIVIVFIKEIFKVIRLKEFNKMDDSKIEAVGNYEKKSKSRTSFFNFYPIKKDSSLRSE